MSLKQILKVGNYYDVKYFSKKAEEESGVKLTSVSKDIDVEPDASTEYYIILNNVVLNVNGEELSLPEVKIYVTGARIFDSADKILEHIDSVLESKIKNNYVKSMPELRYVPQDEYAHLLSDYVDSDPYFMSFVERVWLGQINEEAERILKSYQEQRERYEDYED